MDNPPRFGKVEMFNRISFFHAMRRGFKIIELGNFALSKQNLNQIYRFSVNQWLLLTATFQHQISLKLCQENMQWKMFMHEEHLHHYMYIFTQSIYMHIAKLRNLIQILNKFYGVFW